MTEQPSAEEHVEPPVIESEEDYGLSAELIHTIEDALEAGHGVLLAANHCRPADPIAVGALVKKVGQPINMMASLLCDEASSRNRTCMRRNAMSLSFCPASR